VHIVTSGAQTLDRLKDWGLDRDTWKIGHWQQIWTGANATSIAWHGARHVTVDNSATRRTSRHSRFTQPEQPARRRRQQRRRRAGRGASRRDRVLVSSRTMWSVTFAVPEHEGDHAE